MQCTGEAQLNGCCAHCAKIPAEVQKLVDLALQADSRINHRYLSWSQIRNLLADRTEEARKWRLKSLNTARNFATAVRRLADYGRFMEAIVDNNLPRLHQLISVGFRRGSSPNSRTLDIALLVFRLGGRKLLYAVNHRLGLPSLRTLRTHMAFTKVMPTVGMISIEDIIHNIREVVLRPREAAATPQPLRGVNLLIDEVALEERACHFRHNNSVGGLCWRHSPKVNLQLKSYNDALKIAENIKSGDVHLGKEMTVVSVSCFGESGTYPIMALPTCKSVGPAESSMIYETHAAAKVGMPWSWSTDGEPSRRKAGYDQFVRYKLGPTSPLYGTLAGMAGLNIFTGIHSITLDFDYKHIFKRVCTLIRSAAGMALSNGRIINPAVLTRFLARLPEQSEDSVRKVLFPDDPQDVPRAVELMEAIIDFLAFDFGQVDADTAADLDSIRLLALVLKSILAPFITPDILTFMSNQLYGDSQSMIKNAFFCLAKQQKLDPRLPFYLFQVGDDPLERLFGKLRMLGGHNSAMSYAQAIER
ncbi:hypothetical protein R3P38DRAFT_3318281 [Favolaschia claudopus]|uniref:Uncharacterized protein n=1 Tax=Favolaschia claudopus TaxID=2862362 RepID=A0AAW0B4M5_9AGAR